jgi:para-aminobenzoate synthetase/4-amino-4-deoxychorismate lyase
LDNRFTTLDHQTRNNADSVRDRISAIVQNGTQGWLAFDDPARLVSAHAPDAVRPALADVERLTRDWGLHAVGFIAYEAGAAFGLSVRPPIVDLPLVWFALYEPDRVRRIEELPAGGTYDLGSLRPSIDRETFDAAFRKIKTCLVDGDSYQVNLTFKMRGRFEGDARALFADLVAAQQGRHSAFVHLGDWSICSASPELFFAVDGPTLSARPMKGTARRGRTTHEDARQRDDLERSPKQRAENVMIVDMVRNDLGRIAEVGSVAVQELFTVERYPNVWQMTSLITARSPASLDDIFAALHPSASVTGAPKVRTMEILTELEKEARGVYTGAIGHVWPDGTASFNVAIRTAVVDHRTGAVEFGIGSGVVWDSEAAAEYEECLLKGSIVGRRTPRFELLETTRWTPDEGFLLLDRHIERLRDSAAYFGFVCEEKLVVDALSAAVAGARTPLRVRALVGRNGEVRVEHATLQAGSRPLKCAIAAQPVDSSDAFLFHKTTNREMYDGARVSGADDVILWNQAGQVTEATTANVVADIDGTTVTPPVDCGLLAGTYRAELLARGELIERVITVDDLRRARAIWLINSVHQSRPAVLVS